MEDVILELTCPKCGNAHIKNKTNIYVCTDEENCDFRLFKNFNKKDITPDLLEEIMEAGAAGVELDGFKTKEEDEYSATIAFNKDLCKFHLVYSTVYLEGVNCPDCGGKIVEKPKTYSCEHNDNTLPEEERCPIVIYKEISKKSISDKIAKELLEGKTTDMLTGFISKDKNKFSARLFLDENEKKIKFNSSIGECPKCGGEVKDNPKSYGCANWQAPTSCNFKIWKNQYGYDLTLKDAEDILEKGVTAERTLFNKDKKPYKGKFYYNPKTQEVERI